MIVIDPEPLQTLPADLASTNTADMVATATVNKHRVEELRARGVKLQEMATSNRLAQELEQTTTISMKNGAVHAVELPNDVVPGWLGDAAAFDAGDKVCDCGLGVLDPDCEESEEAEDPNIIIAVTGCGVVYRTVGKTIVASAEDQIEDDGADSGTSSGSMDDGQKQEMARMEQEECASYGIEGDTCVYGECCKNDVACGVCGTAGFLTAVDTEESGLLEGQPICAAVLDVAEINGTMQEAVSGVCDYALRGWHGLGSEYGAGDGVCNCGRGLWDPDCDAEGTIVLADCPANTNETTYMCHNEIRPCYTKVASLASGIAVDNPLLSVGICVGVDVASGEEQFPECGRDQTMPQTTPMPTPSQTTPTPTVTPSPQTSLAPTPSLWGAEEGADCLHSYNCADGCICEVARRKRMRRRRLLFARIPGICRCSI